MKTIKPAYLFAVILLLVIVLRIATFNYYPYYEDEAGSILAAEGIVKHGIPKFPSGMVYARSYLSHYSIALSIILFGDNIIAYRLPSLLASIIIVYLIYLFGKELNQKYAGLLAALAVGFLGYQNFLGHSSRMYMLLQLFYTLTLYFFYKGFIKENNKYKTYAIISAILTIFTHQLGIMLVPTFFIVLISYKRLKWLKDKYFILSKLF